MKSFIMNSWNAVMTVEGSPLRNLDPSTAHMVFQMLAFMWSGIFAVMLGSAMAFGISAIFHVVFIAGIFITLMVFRTAENNPQAFNLRPGYHSVSRTRQNMWIDGKKVTLDINDPGGEHE